MNAIINFFRRHFMKIKPIEGATFTLKKTKDINVVVTRVYQNEQSTWVRYILDREGCYSYHELTIDEFTFRYKYTGMITINHRLFKSLHSNKQKGATYV